MNEKKNENRKKKLPYMLVCKNDVKFLIFFIKISIVLEVDQL